MANDIKILWNDNTYQGDIEYDNGDITRENGIETAVLMSLFTDARASIEDDLPDPENEDRRGWWGDQISVEEGDAIGSKLWLLARNKTDQQTMIRAEAYTKEALQWLIDDGISIKNEVFVERINRADNSATIAIQIKIYQKDGNEIAMKFNDLWQTL